MQDLLSLDNKSRFNTPGTIGDNWSWRLKEFDSAVLEALKDYGVRGSFWERSLEKDE